MEISTPKLPRAEFVVVPAELTDPGILDRIKHRTRLRRYGKVWISEAQVEPTSTRRSRDDTDRELPVIGESRTRIRVAFEDDSARLAMWIAREDTWPVVGVPIQLSDGAGMVSREVGVFANRGAPVALAERKGDRRAVHLLDDDLELRGYVPESVIVKVWITGPGDPPARFSDIHMSSYTPPDPRPHVKFQIDATLRSAPDGSSPVIVRIGKPNVVGVVKHSVGGFRLVEIVRPNARVLGYVAASEVSASSGMGHGSGSGTGHGFGMSHADLFLVPTGTCLFDRADGEVVGVQTEPTTRQGHLARDGSKWSMLYISTSWTVANLYVHDLSDDPTQPRWESCTLGAHR